MPNFIACRSSRVSIENPKALLATVRLQLCHYAASHRVYDWGDLSSRLRLSTSAGGSIVEALALGSVPSCLGCLDCSFMEHLHSPGDC